MLKITTRCIPKLLFKWQIMLSALFWIWLYNFWLHLKSESTENCQWWISYNCYLYRSGLSGECMWNSSKFLSKNSELCTYRSIAMYVSYLIFWLQFFIDKNVNFFHKISPNLAYSQKLHFLQYLEKDRPTSSALQILWQKHVVFLKN